jgi:hypothetical protein
MLELADKDYKITIVSMLKNQEENMLIIKDKKSPERNRNYIQNTIS